VKGVCEGSVRGGETRERETRERGRGTRERDEGEGRECCTYGSVREVLVRIEVRKVSDSSQ
jgi:hypothetical protein